MFQPVSNPSNGYMMLPKPFGWTRQLKRTKHHFFSFFKNHILSRNKLQGRTHLIRRRACFKDDIKAGYSIDLFLGLNAPLHAWLRQSSPSVTSCALAPRLSKRRFVRSGAAPPLYNAESVSIFTPRGVCVCVCVQRARPPV